MNLNDTLIHLLSVNGRGVPRWSSHAQDRLPSIRRLKETITNCKESGSQETRKKITAGLRAALADEIYELSEPAA